MRVGGELLGNGHVLSFPVEEESDAIVDDLDVQGRIDDGLPQRRRAEDAAPAKHEEQDLWGRLDEGIGDTVGQTRRRHCWRQSNKNIDLLVQFRMDG